MVVSSIAGYLPACTSICLAIWNVFGRDADNDVAVKSAGWEDDFYSGFRYTTLALDRRLSKDPCPTLRRRQE